MTPRRTAALLAGLGVALLLGAGCGGGETGETAAETTTVASAPKRPLTKTEATDYAQRVNLRATDVPYFEKEDDEGDEDRESEARLEDELERCVGSEQQDRQLAEVDSPTFASPAVGGFLEVASSVTVWADESEAAREAKVLRGRRATRCLRRFFLALLEEEETPATEAGGGELSRIPSPAPEIDGSFAFRFKTTVTVHGDTSEPVAYRLATESPESQSIDIYMDLLGFVTGPASVTIIAVGAPAPVSKNLEHNLLLLLHERAIERRP